MKRLILHIGGHADGEYKEIELVESGYGGWVLPPGYTLRELAPISEEVPLFKNGGYCVATDVDVFETFYVREEIRYGESQMDYYVDRKLMRGDPGGLIKALTKGYRKPKVK